MDDEPQDALKTFYPAVDIKTGEKVSLEWIPIPLRFVEPDQTDLGASDDRPLGPDHPAYRQS